MEGAGSAQRGRGRHGTTMGQGNANGEGGTWRMGESTPQRVWPDCAVRWRGGCGTQQVYRRAMVLQRRNGGAGLAQGEDTAARWTPSGSGVPTGVCGAAQIDAGRDGGAGAQGIGALVLAMRGVPTRRRVCERVLHGTGVAAHGRGVRQRSRWVR
jgi:hypothetical protein